ncbi:SDR family NAD(P)-dependent oxidoreductase [Fibrivirga algicola]|uniref:SDR family oxidoreductase n=1 Tax=Fibrivirga algicola TaxID=2950420 RepID=A0ABX0QBZ4_9BACT|nr:SDR family oxidoreductase [Fibrivirga algicola]ARK12990.1 short-chain dehydrogenase [Fibrella sp. ES10-3-2-2]NID09447.1 SDR family oxidoreductase [Fibrivirga algicola]
MTFQHQTAIITGAGQGIGFAIARHLAQQGANVVLNDFDFALAEQAAYAIREAGGSCIAYSGDAADVTFIRQLVDTAVGTFGRLDMAIANAGVTVFGDLFTTTPEAFATIVNLNLRGTFFLMQSAATQMRAQGRNEAGSGGRIMLMSSVVGQLGHPGLPVYSMTKAGLQMLARQSVIDLSPHGITINAVAPGATLTERTTDDPTYSPVWSRITPMGRPATVDDIAAAVLFLLSPQASHITGQTLTIDGGWTSVGIPPM